MLKSELIKRLQEEVDKNGDMHLKYVEYEDEEQGSGHYILSPDRKTKSGQRAKANLKEFRQYCKENPIISE